MSIHEAITLAILFISLYFEVFMLITYLEHRRSLHGRKYAPATSHPGLPTVTIIVPCFNEEKTVGKTLDSLLDLDYPKDKIKIMAVNDGSNDGTAQILAKYGSRHPEITVIDKENGGKHTALNMAIKMADTEYIGCLDADSFASRESLIRIMQKFDDPSISAVVPSLHIHAPRTLIQKMQKIEYMIGSFMRSILAELNALYVTPGPLSVFRRDIFDKIGYYRKAHNTEDMEIAFRMQSLGYKIGSAHDAVIYTSSPHSVKKLYKQRVRWTSGFLNNIRDYRFMLFNRKYGHIGGFILPVMLISFISLLFIAGSFAYNIANRIANWIETYQAIGYKMFELSWPKLDWFFMGTNPIFFTAIVGISALLAAIVIGSKLGRSNEPKVIEVVYYMCLYSFIAPFWVIRSFYVFLTGKSIAWR